MMVPSVAERLGCAARKRKIQQQAEAAAMPAGDASGPLALSRCEDDEHAMRSTKLPRKSSSSRTVKPTAAYGPGEREAEDDDVDMVSRAAPMSPRVRKRLDEAKENASVFQPVCEQGEVIQWMTACHPGLLTFGCDLERRGFTTLSSIAFLTEDDLQPSIDPVTKQLLLSTLARLRHELFRM